MVLVPADVLAAPGGVQVFFHAARMVTRNETPTVELSPAIAVATLSQQPRRTGATAPACASSWPAGYRTNLRQMLALLSSDCEIPGLLSESRLAGQCVRVSFWEQI